LLRTAKLLLKTSHSFPAAEIGDAIFD